MRTPSPFAVPVAVAVAVLAGVAAPARAQYTPAAGNNAPAAAYEAEVDKDGHVKRDERGNAQFKVTKEAVQQDQHGNARGNQYDLAVDGAFEGQTVLVLDQVGNSLEETKAALKQKGFSMVAYRHGATPSTKELRDALSKSCEVWLISTGEPILSDDQIALIKRFFDDGHGVYIWGDNDPLYADANRLATALIPGLRMEGNLAGMGEVVGVAGAPHQPKNVGVRAGHLITTGLEHLFEGNTIATIQFQPHQGRNEALYTGGPATADRSQQLPPGFTPLLHGSEGNLVSAAYEKDGKRLVVDGGFTRLSVSWDDAGTARFVKNAAAWLVNSERFHDKVATK